MRRALLASLLLTGLAPLAVPAAAQTAAFRPLPAERWDRAAAAHLLRRAAFGATPAEVDAFLQMGPEAAVARLVDYEPIRYGAAPPLIPELLERRKDWVQLRQLDEDARREYQRQVRMAERTAIEELRLWWIERLVESPRPLEERMTLFWHGHFTSGIREVRNTLFMQAQNELLREHALGNFGELVRAISRDPAMLVYLDGRRNVKRSPNENYARELLELFMLGEGNYSEADIKAAARAFTGWTFNDDGFIFRRNLHDDGEKRFLGDRGRFHGDDVISIILDERECSEYVATCLLQQFLTPTPEPLLVRMLAREIRAADYDLRPVVRTLLRSRVFYEAEYRGALVKSPVMLLAGSARQLGVPVRDLQAAQAALNATGQVLFQPPNVKGWDGGPTWINTATLFHRYNVVGGLLHGTPGGRFGMLSGGAPRRADRRTPLAPQASMQMQAVRMQEMEDSSMQRRSAAELVSGQRPVARRESPAQPPYDPLPILRARGLTSSNEIIDFYTAYYLAVPLHEEKRATLIEYLDDEGQFSLDADDAASRLRKTIHLLMSTPEYQVY